MIRRIGVLEGTDILIEAELRKIRIFAYSKGVASASITCISAERHAVSRMPFDTHGTGAVIPVTCQLRSIGIVVAWRASQSRLVKECNMIRCISVLEGTDIQIEAEL